MSKKTFKPIKRWDMITSYCAGVVGQLLCIVLWFFPTFHGTYFSKLITDGRPKEFDVTFFICDESLPLLTNIINLALLVLSALAVVYFIIPLVKNTVMKPRVTAFPVVLNLVYFALFALRFVSMRSSYPLYDFPFTPVAVLYFFGIVISFSVSLALWISYPKLKKQMALEAEAAKEANRAQETEQEAE